MAMRTECSTATSALICPRRDLMRLYFAPRYVVCDLAAAIAAVPRARFRYLFPGLVCVDLTRPADSLAPGAVPAHDARWPAVGKTDMSAPVSAMMTSAFRLLIPGTVASSSRAALKGCMTHLSG